MEYREKLNLQAMLDLPRLLLSTVELKPSDKIIYQFLIKCCYKDWNPSLKDIQKGTGDLGKNTVIRSIKNLENYNLISVKKIMINNRPHNKYTICDTLQWKCTYQKFGIW